MKNSRVLAAIFVCLAFLISGCQTTFGLSAPPADKPLTIPATTYFLVYGSNDSRGWAKILDEFSPEVRTSTEYIDDPNVNLVILRSTQLEPPIINFPLALGALTICMIPCFEYGSYTADFEVYLAQNRAHKPAKFHYEFWEIHGMWLPTQFGKNKTDPSSPIRELYRQFFADYAKLLNNSKTGGEKNE
jgi:hypothetical protein